MRITTAMAKEIAKTLMADTEANNEKELNVFKEKMKGILLSKITQPVIDLSKVYPQFFEFAKYVNLGYKLNYLKIELPERLPVYKDEWFDYETVRILNNELEPIQEKIQEAKRKKNEIEVIVYKCGSDKQLKVKFPEAYKVFQTIYEKGELNEIITVADI